MTTNREGNHMTTTTKPRFTNIAEIKRANADAGMYWFSAETSEYFKSKVESRVYDPGAQSHDFVEGTRLWVESTRNHDDTAREYRIARFDVASGDISYVSAQIGQHRGLRFRTKAAAVQCIEGVL